MGIRHACTVKDRVRLPSGPPNMTRNSDKKETERAEYITDHTAKRSFVAEIKSLKEENLKLQMKVLKLKKKIKKLQSK